MSNPRNIDQLSDLLKSNNIILSPATKEEITIATGFTDLSKLPTSYVQFLKAMGKGTENGFLKGSSCFTNELPMLKDWAEELLEENNFGERLTEDDFVFWMSQGYQFAFFKLSLGENSPIYYYREGTKQKSFVKITSSLIDFLYRINANDKLLFDIEEAD